MVDQRRNATSGWIWGAAIVLITCVAYLPVLHAGFVWDDGVMVTDNPVLQGSGGLHDIWFTTRPADHMPLTLTFFWLQVKLWGNQPLGFHIVNVLLHAMASVLFWRVLLKLKLPGAWLAAAVFALHPVAAASVAWITEQKNTLSLVAYLAAALCYLQYEEKPTRGRYAVAIAVFVMALLTKGSVVVLPAVLLLVVWWKNQRINRVDVLRLVPFFALAVAEALATIWFQYHRVIAGEVVQTLTPLGRIVAAASAVWFYLWKDIFPVGLCAIYPQWHISTSNFVAYLPVIGLAALAVLLWRIKKPWSRTSLFGLAVFVASLFPVLGFFNMSFFALARVADHLQYIALLCPIAVVVCGLTWLLRGRLSASTGAMIGVVVLIGLSVLTWQRASVYRNEETLWRDNIRKSPASSPAYNNLAIVLVNSDRASEAQAMAQRALDLAPNSGEALNTMGIVLDKLGKPADAASYYEKAVQRSARKAKALTNWGQNLVERGKVDDGIAKLREAVQHEPNNADALESLASALMQKGAFAEAVDFAGRALEVRPTNPNLHYIAGTGLLQLGRKNEAAGELQRACELDPNSVESHHNLALALRDLGMTNEAASNFLAAAVLGGRESDTMKQDISEALRLRPDWTEAKEAAAKLLSGDANAKR